MFGEIIYTYFKKVKHSQEHSYLLTIRNPIESAVTAFNWTCHLVVEMELQRDSTKGEYQVLRKYPDLNSISEKLYSCVSDELDQ